ncbi:Creb-Regulated Transcription Coactivator 2 [Manis pentadactyla]|nr:Creb-Regulated Transcription Coactivator 2 [Manis pentadactyla]
MTRERMKVKQELPWGQFASCAGEMPLDLFISLFIPQQKDSTKTVSEAYVKQNRVPVVSYVQYQTQNSMFQLSKNIYLKRQVVWHVLSPEENSFLAPHVCRCPVLWRGGRTTLEKALHTGVWQPSFQNSYSSTGWPSGSLTPVLRSEYTVLNFSMRDRIYVESLSKENQLERISPEAAEVSTLIRAPGT